MYNPKEHLIKIRAKDGSMKDYYPVNWRLYELGLKQPDLNFETEVVYLDVEKDVVVVKVMLFAGTDYATSDRKTQAVKSGRLSQIDRVETAAKGRCCINFGISTEAALDAGKIGTGKKSITPVFDDRPYTWSDMEADLATADYYDQVARERSK